MRTSFVSPVESSGFEGVFNQFTEIGSALVFDDSNFARKRFVSNMLVATVGCDHDSKSRDTHNLYPMFTALNFCKQSHSYEIAISERYSLLALNAMTSM